MIPSKFCIGGGKEIKIYLVDRLLDDNGNSRFGEFNEASNIIKIAKNVKADSIWYSLTNEDIERTFWHELIHCFQFYAGMDTDEMVAQTFSNFIWEYNHTKGYEDNFS